jgi:uncharacterized protein YukE
MRALAASLRGDAATVASLADGLAAEVSGMTFEGPAATEFFDRMQATSQRCTDLAARLLDLASLLEVAATEVEIAQRERLRRMEEMRREALAEAPGGAL